MRGAAAGAPLRVLLLAPAAVDVACAVDKEEEKEGVVSVRTSVVALVRGVDAFIQNSTQG